jgi:aspartate racemase
MPETGPSRLVGILGGMGPGATVDFYDKLVRATPAARDQDHLRVVIWADPTVPDRQHALLAGGEDPTPWLAAGVSALVGCGAEILVVPCNAIHAYLPAVVERTGVEFISIIDVTVAAVGKANSTGRVGLLATDGALTAGFYQAALAAAGLEPVLPSTASQQRLMRLVHDVKAGRTGPSQRSELASLLSELEGSGVWTVIAACTEISVLLAHLDVPQQVVDPAQVLALETVRRARR